MTRPDVPPTPILPAGHATNPVGAASDLPVQGPVEDSGLLLLGGVLALAFVVYLLWRRGAHKGDGGGGAAG